MGILGKHLHLSRIAIVGEQLLALLCVLKQRLKIGAGVLILYRLANLADSADSGQAFRLKADSESGRSRTAFR
jgi:hypothetical protein